MAKIFHYPFTAISGQEEAKSAILLLLINPKIGSLLITGDKGTAKSTLVRGMPFLVDSYSLVEAPLHITEDRLIGGINMKQMVVNGIKSCEPGILARANGNILYVDEINLLSQSALNLISHVSESKTVQVAREGITAQYPSDFLFIGTMNLEEGQLSAKILDRFSLCVHIKSELDLSIRKEIICNRLHFENNKEQFCAQHEEALKLLKQDIQAARERLPLIDISDDFKRLAAEITLQACCEGHRADIYLLETARAIAALNKCTELSFNDIQEAAKYVLTHRMRQLNEQEREEPQRPQELQNKDDHHDEQQLGAEGGIDQEFEQEKTGAEEGIIETTIDSPLGQFHLKLIEESVHKEIKKREGNGKRNQTKTNKKIGRYVKAIHPKGEVSDIAFDATLRVASLYQKNRTSTGNFLTIHSSDIRQKVREKRIGKTILFVVDASGSMGVNKRMQAVKAAVMSLLQEAYQKRDKVGLITFANNESHVLLEPTRSIDLANKKLAEIPTGGNTPLVSGMEAALKKLEYLNYREIDYSPFLVLITDGRANASKLKINQLEAACKLCEEIQALHVKSMVLDTETGFIKLGQAKKLAEALNGAYCQMGEFDSEQVVDAIKHYREG